ncbi:MAG: hypothetical protein R3266_03645 [Gemmatimonadota bacterium]|nr:hypothetical protein [Gemmatimonadota bacterium]
MSAKRPSPVGLLLAAGIVAAIAGLSRVPWTVDPERGSVLRLSWRFQPEGESGCRRPTAEELAELPPHMRNPDACVREAVPYLLELRIDGVRTLADTLHAAGARQDRPVFVYRDVAIDAGAHTIEVGFSSLEPEGPGSAGDTPPGIALSWSDSVTVDPREIVLIGYDRASRSLVRARPGPDGAR